MSGTKKVWGATNVWVVCSPMMTVAVALKVTVGSGGPMIVGIGSSVTVSVHMEVRYPELHGWISIQIDGA